jgi:CRISPR/Cas system-associated protein Csm6
LRKACQSLNLPVNFIRKIVSKSLNLFSGGSGRLSTAELNSLIAYAHRRIDQLQRQLVEQQTLEPMRVQEALSKAKSAHEKQIDTVVAEEQQAASAELDSLRKTWVCML